jgi:hypothetical protein
MILISHRGNINGPIKNEENKPKYIDKCLNIGYDIEIDLWLLENKLYLGHDEPMFNIDKEWLLCRYNKLWVHCKDIRSLYFLKELNNNINYFYHQNDDVTITSKGFFWTYPGKELTRNSIAVMPETFEFENIYSAYGICSDFIINYKL